MFCLNFLHSLKINNKLKSHKKVCQNKGFRSVVITSKDTKILEFNQPQKSDKALSMIYVEYFNV